MTADRPRTVLVVDDHADIRALVTDYLEASNFRVLVAESGPKAIQVVNHDNPDLVILDLTLPGCDGFEVCRQIRKDKALPILVLSARTEDLDKILMLELGADDYLTKPFNPRELVARVQATFRRMTWDREVDKEEQQVLVSGALKLNLSSRQAWYGDDELALTPIEYSLLSCLLQHRGQNLTRQQILDQVWGQEYFGDERTVDAHIRTIRQKLRAAEESFRPILSVWGVGYRFEG